MLPLVGSTITERPGSIAPSRSAASIIATPMRSFTEPPGFMYSSLATTSASISSPIRRKGTMGVSPMASETSRANRLRFSPLGLRAPMDLDPGDQLGGQSSLPGVNSRLQSA